MIDAVKFRQSTNLEEYGFASTRVHDTICGSGKMLEGGLTFQLNLALSSRS